MTNYPYGEKLDLILREQAEIKDMLRAIFKLEKRIMSATTDALDELEKQLTAIDGAEDSAEAGFLRLAALIASLKTDTTDPATAARITAVSDTLKARAARLAAAVDASPQS